MAEKNSLWKNIRNKAAQNKRTGATPKKPSAEMLRQERKIKAKKYYAGGPIGEGDDKNKALKGTNDTLIAPTLNTQIVEEEAPQWMKDKETIRPDEVNFWESFNPKKWGLNDYSNYSSFNSAFRNAREAGEDEFVWNKERYNTNLIPKDISDQYWDSKKFMQDYYTNEPFIPLDTNYFDLHDFNDKLSKDKYGYTWQEYYDKVSKTPVYSKDSGRSDEEGKILDSYFDTLDLLNKNRSGYYGSLSDKEKSDYYTYQKSKYVDALNDPNYYFSITSQPNPENRVLGYQNSGDKKLYATNTGNRKTFTTFIHELSHKGDSKSRASYSDKSSRIPTVDADVLNQFGTRLSQERFDYVSEPTETEARKMATLYFMNKILKKDISSGKIKNQDLTDLYNLFNSEGGYGRSRSIPIDVQDLLELYQYQWNDLLKYLNNDFSYMPVKKAEGGPVNTLEGDLISKVIMNRNRNKDFVQRAYAVGEYPESNMFVQPDANEFGQKNSHLMSWGEDERGQSYMYPEVMNPNNEAIKVPNQYADYISSTGYKKATGMSHAQGGYMYNTGGPFNKDMSAELQFNDDKLRNTILNSPLNEGSFVFKPATDWAKNWVSDPEYAARLSQNFPDRSRITKVDTVFQSKKDVREDKREKNLKEAYNYIPRLVGDIGDTKFLYNSNPAINDQLYKDYYSIYNKEDVADVKRELKDDPQAFTDPYGNAIIRNKANDPGQAGAMSAANHEIWHQLEIPSSKEDMFGNTTYETVDRAYDGKFATPDPSTWFLDERGQPKMPSKKEFYPMLMQIRMDNNFQPGEEIDDARLDQIRKAGSTNPLFRYFNNEQLKTYLNTFASNQTQAPMQYAARGGYMYNNGGFTGEDGDGKRKPTYLSPAELGGRQVMEPSTTATNVPNIARIKRDPIERPDIYVEQARRYQAELEAEKQRQLAIKNRPGMISTGVQPTNQEAYAKEMAERKVAQDNQPLDEKAENYAIEAAFGVIPEMIPLLNTGRKGYKAYKALSGKGADLYDAKKATTISPSENIAYNQGVIRTESYPRTWENSLKSKPQQYREITPQEAATKGVDGIVERQLGFLTPDEIAKKVKDSDATVEEILDINREWFLNKDNLAIVKYDEQIKKRKAFGIEKDNLDKEMTYLVDSRNNNTISYADFRAKIDDAKKRYQDLDIRIVDSQLEFNKLLKKNPVLDKRFEEKLRALYNEAGLQAPSFFRLPEGVVNNPQYVLFPFSGQDLSSYNFSQKVLDHIMSPENLGFSMPYAPYFSVTKADLPRSIRYYEELIDNTKKGTSPFRLTNPKSWFSKTPKKPTIYKETVNSLQDPSEIAHTIGHEDAHPYQNINNWASDIFIDNDPKYKYYTNHRNNPVSQKFADSMIEPTLPNPRTPDRKTSETWLSATTELHADLQTARVQLIKDLKSMYGWDNKQATEYLKQNHELFTDHLIEHGNLDRFFKPGTTIETKRSLINQLPAVIGATATGVVGSKMLEGSQPEQQAYGGYINPYMYYSGGPMEYGRGGNFLKHLGAGAYSVGEGMLDTVTGGATDQLTDKGFEWLTKVGNKNMDLSDPANARFLKTQQQIKGYGNTAAAVTTGILTGNVQGAVTQGAKGLNTAFQASDWATDDFKKWSGISSQAIGIGAGIAGGALNTEGASKGASEAAAKVGEIGGKVSPYVNQAVSMFGSNQQPMWQQAQAQQNYLNSPEYKTQQSLNNQQYVNQGLSFSHGGNITNNSLNLQSMKGRYQNYKQRMSKGGTFNQHGIDFIPESAGLHHQSAYGGVPIGPDALAEGGEIKMDTPDGGQYIVSDQVDGTQSQMDFTFSKGGKYKELNRTLADGMKQDLNKYSMGSLATNSNSKDSLRRPMDSYSNSTIDQIKQKWQQKTEFARQRSQQEQAIAQAEEQKRLIEEEYIAAYGGKINPKKYPGLNRSKKSKGGYVYNAMTQPMLAQGGPTDPPSNKLISNDRVLGYITDMNERGMLEPGKTFQPSWYSDIENRQVDLNKELSKVDLERVKSFYNYKQSNRNIFGFAQGGPMVSNVQQPFNGPAAQNRGGMMMADGGMMPQEQQMMQQQMMQQQQMPQQGGQDQMMQVVQQVAEAIMGGADPRKIMQDLMKSGMPEEQVQQVIQVAMKEIEGQQQGMQGMQMAPEQAMAMGGAMYAPGGFFDNFRSDFNHGRRMAFNKPYRNAYNLAKGYNTINPKNYPNVFTEGNGQVGGEDYAGLYPMTQDEATQYQGYDPTKVTPSSTTKGGLPVGDENVFGNDKLGKGLALGQAAMPLIESAYHMFNKPKYLNSPVIKPATVDYTGARTIDQRQTDMTENSYLDRLRNSASTSGMFANNAKEFLLKSNEDQAARTRTSIENQMNFNSQEEAKAAAATAQYRFNTDQLNTEMDQARLGNIFGSLNNAASSAMQGYNDVANRKIQEIEARSTESSNVTPILIDGKVYQATKQPDGYYYNGKKIAEL